MHGHERVPVPGGARSTAAPPRCAGAGPAARPSPAGRARGHHGDAVLGTGTAVPAGPWCGSDSGCHILLPAALALCDTNQPDTHPSPLGGQGTCPEMGLWVGHFANTGWGNGARPINHGPPPPRGAWPQSRHPHRPPVRHHIPHSGLSRAGAHPPRHGSACCGGATRAGPRLGRGSAVPTRGG